MLATVLCAHRLGEGKDICFMIIYCSNWSITLYKDEQAEAWLREAAGHNHNTKFVFLLMQPYRASYIHFLLSKRIYFR